MLINVTSIGENDFFDFCVVGAGPAGITCALELAKSGRKVVLLEGGQANWTDWSQGLYKGEVVGDRYFDLDVARLRYLGGTSNHWGGWCRKLDDIDFTSKGTFSETSWPIGSDELVEFETKALDILKVPAIPEDVPLSHGFRRIYFQKSPPVRFGEEFGDVLESMPNIFLVLDANLIEIETNGTATTGVRIASSGGVRKIVRSSAFVIAAGGLENSRLLLWGNETSNGQLVKNADSLGRYWTEHPQAIIGQVIVDESFVYGPRDSNFAAFAPDSEKMKQLGILNGAIGLWRQESKGKKKLLADIACVAPDLARSLSKKIYCGAEVSFQWELEPRRDNRIVLGSELDALGIPRLRLEWTKSATDLHTMRAAAEAFGVYMAENDIGRVRLDGWLYDDDTDPKVEGFRFGSWHHIGGTRMAASPDRGVVDSNCRVFGQDNLYVAGSSVFPSGGFAHPTLSIVQLSLRLAKHLKAVH